MPNYGTTLKWGLRKLLGSPNVVSDIDQGIQALADDIDAIMAIALQGSLASRPTSTSGTPGKTGRWYYATDAKLLSYDYGTGWLDIAFRPPLVASWAARPSSPVDGQEFILEPEAGTLWTFRYRASATRWELVAGPAFHDYDATERSTAATARALLTDAPTFVAPFTGRYEVATGFTGHNTAAAIIYQQLADPDNAISDFAASHLAAGAVGSPSIVQRVNLTGGVSYAAYNYVGSGTGFFRHRWLRVQPIHSTAA